MIKGPKLPFGDDPGDWEGFICDYKDSPDDVMEQVHQFLKPFGLEVVEYNTGGDSHHAFNIRRIEKKAKKGKK